MGSGRRRRPPPFGISMLGRNEFALRNSRPLAGNSRRKSAAPLCGAPWVPAAFAFKDSGNPDPPPLQSGAGCGILNK